MSTAAGTAGMAGTVGPYSPWRRVGDLIVTSGQIGVGPGGGLVTGGTEPELRQALQNLSGVLGAAGASLADVVKATVFLVDMGDFGAVNAIWVEAFAPERPARSAVGVAALPLGARVEVEAWAVLPAP